MSPKSKYLKLRLVLELEPKFWRKIEKHLHDENARYPEVIDH